MSILVQATSAPKPKTKNVKKIAILYALILLVFGVSQLFTYESFITLIDSFWLPGGTPFARVVTAVVVIAEVLALPFLLSMRTSVAMRVLSMACGWLVAFIWLMLTLWIMLSVNAISNVGYLGDLVVLFPGWWAVFFSAALVILSIWTSWGMWPLGHKK